MNPIVYLIVLLLNVLEFALLVYIIMSLLIQFRVVNFTHPLVKIIWDTLYRIFEPILKRIRKFIPVAGGIDLSPIVVFIAIMFIRYTIVYYF